MTTSGPRPLVKALTPELRASLVARTDYFLFNIITANWTTQYATQAPSLAPFRDTLAAHGKAVYATLLDDFRSFVPVTDYESYKPWIARFHEIPCKESRVEDLFAPGLPYSLSMSSSTSGKEPKLFPLYQHTSFEYPAPRPIFDFSDTQGPIAFIIYYGYREIKQVERQPGQIVKRLPVCLASAGRLRMKSNWHTETDEYRFSTISAYYRHSCWTTLTASFAVPGQVAPWGANMIIDNRAFLMIHALFCLTRPDMDQIFVTFATTFVDMVRCMDEEWNMVVACIRDGKIPDLDGLGHLRVYLQVCRKSKASSCMVYHVGQAAFNANPARADELRKIGPPSLRDGWAARVWPRLRRVAGICSGSFGTCIPQVNGFFSAMHVYIYIASNQVKAILGPTIVMRNHGYGASEAHMSVFFDPNDPETFVLETEEAIEFVDAESSGITSDVVQAVSIFGTSSSS